MRKILSGILAISVLLSCISISSIASEATDAPYTREVEIVKGLGLADESFDADSDITRAGFIKLVSKLMLKNMEMSEYPYSAFSDITSETNGYREICMAYEMGYISRGEDKLFRPEDGITYNEAVKILVSVLGYDEMAKMDGGYPTGYLTWANKLQLTRNIEVSDMNVLTNEEAAMLVVSALDCGICQASTIKEDGLSYVISDETLLYSALGIEMVSGILESNAYTDLLTGHEIDYKISVNGIVGEFYDIAAQEKYLGYDVDAYLKADKNDENIFVCIIPSAHNKVTEISADEFYGYSNGAIQYETGEGKEKKIEIAPEVSVIYNGKAELEKSSELFDIYEGSIKLIDNNGNGGIDVVVITEYVDYPLAGIDAINYVVSDMHGKQLDLDNTDNDRSIIIRDEEGKELTFADLKAGMVISAAVSKDKSHIRAFASTKTSTDDYVGYSTDGNGTISAKIGENEYVVSKSFPEEKVLELVRGRGVAYFNVFGKLAAYKSDSMLDKYAMIIGVSCDNLAGKGVIKLMKASGAIKTFNLADTFKINGVKVSDQRSLGEKLKKNEIIIFTLNNKEEITNVETKDGEVLNIVNPGSKTMTYWGGTYTFSDSLYVRGGYDRKYYIPIMCYPDDEGGGGEYRVYEINEYSTTAAAVVYGYNTNPKSFIPDVVAMKDGDYLKSGRIIESSPKFVFESLEEGINVSGDFTYFINAHTIDGSKVKLELESTEVYDNLLKSHGEEGKLTAGDLFAASRISWGVVDVLDKFFDYETKTFPAASKFAPAKNHSYKPAFGYLYEKGNDVIGISNSPTPQGITEVKYFPNASSVKVYIVRVSAKGNVSVRTGSVAELTDSVNDSMPTELFYALNTRVLSHIVVYEED